MPGPRHKCYTPIKVSVDPLTKCLDANGTYICTAYNSRCYIIQKKEEKEKKRKKREREEEEEEGGGGGGGGGGGKED
ncbi:hypothetical protein M8J76_009501 [Diaphorina citri]|nr:hypothetical protein M8J76_009501 [Diaphorina citri]